MNLIIITVKEDLEKNSNKTDKECKTENQEDKNVSTLQRDGWDHWPTQGLTHPAEIKPIELI